MDSLCAMQLRQAQQGETSESWGRLESVDGHQRNIKCSLRIGSVSFTQLSYIINVPKEYLNQEKKFAINS